MERVREQARAFLALHHGNAPLVLPNAWDAATARLVEAAGFPALATTSSGIAHSRGYPDGNRIGRAEMLVEVGRIARAVAVPVSADLETGYGATPEEVAETVRLAIEAGVVGANLEDGTHDPDLPLFPPEVTAERIRTVRDLTDGLGVEFVVNARTDPFLIGRTGPDAFADAVTRGNRYLEAGARCVFVPGVADRETIAALVRAIDGPVNVLASERTPPIAVLAELGVARVSLGGGLARAALAFVRRSVEALRDGGEFGFLRSAIPHTEMDRLSDR